MSAKKLQDIELSSTKLCVKLEKNLIFPSNLKHIVCCYLVFSVHTITMDYIVRTTMENNILPSDYLLSLLSIFILDSPLGMEMAGGELSHES
jgi:hypothetical protein